MTAPLFARRNGGQQFGNQWLKIGEAIGNSAQHDDCDRESREMLLKRKIPVDSDKYVELFRGKRKEFPVLDG